MARIDRDNAASSVVIADASQIAKDPSTKKAKKNKALALPNAPLDASISGTVDPLAAAHANALIRPAESRAEAIAERLGLTDVYRGLLVHGAKTAKIQRGALERVQGQVFQVGKDTPLGFTERPGDVVWPPNQSEGRGLGLAMTRTLLIRVGDNAVIKVKGAGQAYDHPGQQTQRVNDRKRPPIPNPILWNRDFMRTGTTHFGLQDTFAQDEFSHLLVVHALSKAVFGRFANAPIPIDAVRLEEVHMHGEPMSIVRARSDESLWVGHEGYFAKDLADMFERVADIDEDLVLGADNLKDFEAAAKQHGKKRQEQLLTGFGFDVAKMSSSERNTTYARALLASNFTDTHPLGQIVMLEDGQFRNNIARVWNDRGVAPDLAALRKQVLDQYLTAWGFEYKPAKGLEPYRAAIQKNVERVVADLGRMYGMLRAFGAETEDGFHPKDSILGQVTDFIDYDMPLPIPAEGTTLPEFTPLDEWPMYMGGIDQTVSALGQLFELPYDDQRKLNLRWRSEARSAAKKTVAAGLEGRLDHLLGDHAEKWTAWIQSEIAQANGDDGDLRSGLAGMKTQSNG